jgi:DNA repair protein RecO (recombination protein O)
MPVPENKMTHKTKGIVLRTVKYGETSIVATLFTELFGVQTYMVNGARSTKRTGTKAIMLQPASLLELEVYHNDLKNMQRIRECNWSYLYERILSDVTRNSIALYMVELLYKMLKQPEAHADLFYFCEDAFRQLDKAENSIAANLPLYFTLQLPQFFGFNIHASPSGTNLPWLDLKEGDFVSEQPQHPHFISGENAAITAELLKVMHPSELNEVKLNQQARRELLLKYQEYYALHLPDFGMMKTLPVLREVLG